MTSLSASRTDRGARDRILVVEDEPEFAGLLELWLRQAGYEAVVSSTGQDALRRFYDVHPALVLLDLSVPGLDGWQVLERLREFSRVPVLLVTARSSEADKVRGLRLGADDYITKPLSFPELLARIEAALRRAASAPPERPRRVAHRSLLVDFDDHRASLRGSELRLTPTEFRLLGFLVENAGQLVTHQRLLSGVWGQGYQGDVHLVRMTVRNLRHKLEAAAPGEPIVATEYGLGYRLVGPASDSAGTR